MKPRVSYSGTVYLHVEAFVALFPLEVTVLMQQIFPPARIHAQTHVTVYSNRDGILPTA
jgi:hypothetical protein